MNDIQADKLLLLLERIADALERRVEIIVADRDQAVAKEVSQRLIAQNTQAQQSSGPYDSYYIPMQIKAVPPKLGARPGAKFSPLERAILNVLSDGQPRDGYAVYEELDFRIFGMFKPPRAQVAQAVYCLWSDKHAIAAYNGSSLSRFNLDGFCVMI